MEVDVLDNLEEEKKSLSTSQNQSYNLRDRNFLRRPERYNQLP